MPWKVCISIFKVTIIKYDAHAHIIHLLVLVYMLECVPKR